MKYLNHPLFGDKDYDGDKVIYGLKSRHYYQFVKNTLKVLPRQALHAKTLGFTHPRTKQRMFFDSPLPEDMQLAIERWRKFAQIYAQGENLNQLDF
jgi:23S rRNA pseudouridine1911/1915/1917 synthase